LSSTELIGSFDQPEDKNALSHLRLVVPVKDFSLDWRRYNLVANYLAEYSAYHFEHKDKAENLISSVFYELIEHMVAASRHEARLDMQLCTAGTWLVFDVSSSFPRDGIQRLAGTLQELREADIDAYYTALLENDLDKPSVRRDLGLAMVAHDYRARLAAALDTDTGAVTLRARISQEEIAS
jgi:hypothetical protein